MCSWGSPVKNARPNCSMLSYRPVDRHVEPLVEQALLLPDSVRAESGEFRGEFGDARVERVGGNHLMHQTPGDGRARVDCLTGQQEPRRVRRPDQRGHQGRVDHRGDSDRHFRHAECRPGFGDPQIAAHRDLEPTAEAVPGQSGDDGNGTFADRLAQGCEPTDERLGARPVQVDHLVDVGTADERRLPRAAQHDHPDVTIAVDGAECLCQFLHGARADDVEPFRIGQLDGEYAAVTTDPDEPLLHRVHAPLIGTSGRCLGGERASFGQSPSPA